MKITTYHPSDFNLLDPLLKIDPSKGQYWEDDGEFRYRSILPKLHAILGSDQIVWCVFNRDDYILTERHIREYVEWEYVGEECAVRYIKKRQWNDLVQSKYNVWTGIVLSELPLGHSGYCPLVLNNLARCEWWRCHGSLATLGVQLQCNACETVSFDRIGRRK